LNAVYLLHATWIIPAVSCLGLLGIPAKHTLAMKRFAAASALVNLFVVVAVVISYAQAATPGVAFAFTHAVPWFSAMNIQLAVGVDGMAVLMMLLTAIVIFCGVLVCWGLESQVREFFILLNVLVSGVFGVFISLDLFMLFLFYEVAVLPMYLLIGVWGTGNKEYSAMKLTLMLVAGSAFIFAGILGLYFASGISSFHIAELAAVEFSHSFQMWAFPVIFVGFGVLGALYPFHTWSPDGHAAAPTAVSMLHAGVLMKLGGFGCLRVALYLLPEGAHAWIQLFLILSTINVMFGAFGALRQTDLKYITAYSSVSHCGLVLFGFCALTAVGIKGGILQMVSHGLMTALFFALIGMIYGRTKTREISQMGGLMKVMPFLSVAFVIVGLAGLGLPSLSGFVAEVTVFVGAFSASGVINRVCTVLVISSIVVTAVYVLRAANGMLHGPLPSHFAALRDATLMEKVPVIVLLFCLFAMGIAPGWIINLVEYSVAPVMQQLGQ